MINCFVIICIIIILMLCVILSPCVVRTCFVHPKSSDRETSNVDYPLSPRHGLCVDGYVRYYFCVRVLLRVCTVDNMVFYRSRRYKIINIYGYLIIYFSGDNNFNRHTKYKYKMCGSDHEHICGSSG